MKVTPRENSILTILFFTMLAIVMLAIMLSGCASLPRIDPMQHVELQSDGGYRLLPSYDVAVAERERLNAKRMWGCTAFDWVTTAVGLGIGLAEANPLGILIVPIAFALNHHPRKQAMQGNDSAETTAAVAHCGAGAWNIAQIAGAL